MRLKQKYVLSLRAEVYLRTRVLLYSASVTDFQIYILSCFVSIIFNRLNSILFTLHIFVTKRSL